MKNAHEFTKLLRGFSSGKPLRPNFLEKYGLYAMVFFVGAIIQIVTEIVFWNKWGYNSGITIPISLCFFLMFFFILNRLDGCLCKKTTRSFLVKALKLKKIKMFKISLVFYLFLPFFGPVPLIIGNFIIFSIFLFKYVIYAKKTGVYDFLIALGQVVNHKEYFEQGDTLHHEDSLKNLSVIHGKDNCQAGYFISDENYRTNELSRTEINPASTLPMIDSAVDMNFNYWGMDSHDMGNRNDMDNNHIHSTHDMYDINNR
ncbi:hypothetical protein M5U04_13930 [Xenorhabdus sp. XENO-1]|uniref:hypothetical protein n=1 Tax=Xenorhabdus bovienii TaxID=40576 RepID=UPI0020CA4EEF|nr:hypothetical protein [Xenorhabdus bovienii]MCP9269156.1 hypothetical protein [Xenorhabdus bovienii subsp. africana]